MQYNRLTSETALADALKNLDKRISTVETKGTGTIGFVGSDGVELRVGKNPDGTVGITPFIGDTTPPPVTTPPIATVGPGFITVVWDGLFVNGEATPADFVHLNVIGHKIVNGVPTTTVAVGMIRATLDSCLVGTDIAVAGETWEFGFTSEDYNGNISVESAASERVVQKSFAADALITDALDGLAQDYINAQSAAASAQSAADAAQNAANANALALTSKGTVYTQNTRPAADANGLWIDTAHNNIPRSYIGTGKALYVNFSSGSSVGPRLTALGWNVTTVTANPTLAEALTYDLVAFDAGYAALGPSSQTLAKDIYNGGVSVYTSGNDTTAMAPLFLGTANRGAVSARNPIRATGATTAGTGWANYSDNDLALYLTGVDASAAVTGVTLVGPTDQPINVVMENPTKFNRWVHLETYATPAPAMDAHLNWISDNWVAIQDQSVVASITAAQTKADQAFNNAATAATAAGTAQTTADSKNRSWYQATAPAGTSHKVGDSWYDTANGYRLSTWNGTIWQTTQDSALAQLTADSKGRTYTQDTVPPVAARLPQNLWNDTSAGPGLYVTKYWDGAAWTALKDKDAKAAQDTADAKGETIYSSTTPAAAKQLPQNTWVDTTGGLNITKRWDTGTTSWVIAVDSRIPSTAAAVTAVDARVSAVSATADSKGITYTQATVPPVSARLPQNTWIDISLGLDKAVTKYWDGSAWTAVSDKSASDAQATADAKGETIYSDTAPPVAKQLPQNTWVDTTGGINITKRWVAGSGWVITVDSRIPSTAAAVTAVDSRVTGVSAAAGAAVSTVDARVTGVSAAAGTAIGTVDSRVTGVSAAAGAAVSAVDSKVSSVSAANSAAVSAVDSRVTAVSAVAESKGEIIYSSTAPAASKQLPQNQWVDTTGGINIVKRWNVPTGTWVVASDQRIDTTAAAVTAVDTRVTGVSAAASTGLTTVDARVTGVSAAAGSAVSTVDARVTGVSAAANTQIGTVDTRVTGVSAAAGSGISVVDSRVTGVSAAASTQIGTVDTRVTGVSAAANTAVGVVDSRVSSVSAAVTSVDTRVTGVSAAAGSAIGTVDARVTGVSASANSQIGTVDSRVTGVSAAASTAVGTVDARVTGVSAAAASAVGTVDSRVTGVSAAAASGLSVVDARVTAVSATTDTKTKTYFQNTQPSLTGNTAGDLWFNTADGNKAYVWNGAWTVAQDSSISKSLFGTFSTDIDNQSPNKWMFSKYDKTSAALTPSYLDIVGIAATSSLVADGTNLVQSVGDNYIGQLRTIVNVVSSKTIAITATHDDGAQIYVDGVSVYSKSVYTQNAAISFFVSAGWHVIDVLWSEAAGGDGFYAISPTIGSQVTSMFAPVSLSSTTKAVADAQTAATNAMNAQAYSLNASFDDWTAAYPTGYAAWSSAPVKETSIVKRAPYSMRFNVPDATTQYGVQWTSILAHAPNLEFFTVEVDLYLVSGTLDGTGMILDWTGLTNNRAQINFVSEIPGALTGKWYRVSKVLRRPTNSTGTWTAMSGYLMGQWSGHGTGAAKNVIYDWFNIRPSTFEEILAYKAPTTADLTVVDTRVTGVSAAAGTAIGTVDARVTGVSAAANTQIGTVDTRVTGVSAAAGSAIGTVDTRVTGVSAAAGSAITNVDTRVTGVSAAAGSAITNVDTRVTGVSAAAASGITVVDTRVSSVSASVTSVDSRVTGVSAAAGSAISGVDARVTGVSAAASTAVGTVDARVTGVSAAAGTAITSVDTRVTGVSAAASSEATSKANAAQAAAIAAAAIDATTKADAAKAAADRAASQTVNKLVNPSFDPDFSNWSKDRAVLDTTAPRSGVNSARVDGGAVNIMTPSPTTVPVVAGQKWRIGVWYKTSSDYNGTAGNGKIRWGDQTTSLMGASTFLPNKTTWTWIEIERTIGASETAISLTLPTDHTVGKIWFDDVEIRDVTELRSLEAAATQAKTDAIAAAALDATTKATNAQNAAITTSGVNADVKVAVVDSRVSSVSAAVTSVDSRVTGVSAAAGSAIGTVDARVTGVSSAAGSAINTVDARVTGVSSAAGTAIGTVDARVTGVSSAAASGISVVDSRVSSVSAGVTSVDSRVTGVSAAAGSAISTVDARVTGVSSAAGSAIGTVDARVSGVSAAAGSAISTVDGRVTGVSAAAGTAIGGVDARVTAVSAAASGQIGTVDSRVTGVSAASAAANDKAIYSTFPTDIDTGATNKWLFTRYNKTTSAGTSPTFTDIIGYAGTSSIVSDASQPVANQADNYIGQIRTIVNVAVTKNIAFIGGHDDGGRIYVDGVSVYSAGSTTAGASFSFQLTAGWHVLDFLWAEQTGNDGWTIGTTISSQVTSMFAPVSNTAVSSMANTALLSANGKNKVHYATTDASGTTDPTDGNRPFIDGDTWFKRSTVSPFNIIAQWEFVGGVWTQRKLDGATLSSLDAGTITVGAMHGDRIQANTISATKLAVTDFNNLFDNGRFTMGTDGLLGWNAGAGTVVTDAGVPSGKAMSIAGVTGSYPAHYQTRDIPFAAGEQLRVKALVKRSATATGIPSVRTMFLDASKAMLANSGVGPAFPAADIWVPLAGKTTAPANTAFVRLWVEFSSVTGSTGYVSDIQAYRMNAGELLVDGALDAYTITGATIQTDSTPASAARGIKLTSAEFAGYDASGVKNFSLTAGGTLALRGALQSGSSIQGASVAASGIYTNPSPTAGVKIADTGIKAYNGSGVLTFHLDSTTGLLEVPGLKANAITSTMISATAIDGKSITGATMTGGLIQTDNTAIDTAASRGIKLTTSGLFGYDGSGNKTFNLTSAGTLAIKGNILSGSTITGVTLSAAGGGIETNPAISRGVKLQDTGIISYDGSGNVTFKVDAATGLVEAPGIKAGSISSAALSATAIDGKTITGATLTGGLIQTDNTAIDTAASRGIKLTTSGLFGYDNTGAKTFNLSNTGALTLKGNILSGSTITGAQLAAAGGGIVTSLTGSTGVKITDQGIKAYDGTNLTFHLDATTGMLEVPGIKANTITSTMISATAIDGKTVTGATIQTNSTPASAATGIKLTSTELAGYSTPGTKTFSLASDGTLSLTGAIKAGSTIEGAKITGTQGLETSTLATTGVKINNAGIKAYDGANNLTFSVDAATGLVKAPGIEANSITGDKIVSQTIAANKLAVADFTNLATIDELNGTTISSYGQTAIVSGWNAQANDANTFFMFTEKRSPVPFKLNDTLYFEFDAKATSATTADFTVWSYNAADTNTSTVKTVSISSTSTTVTGEIKLTSVIADAKKFVLGLGNVANKGIQVKNVHVYKKNGGELIVDGAIQTNHMKSGTIDGGVITAGSLTSVQIKAKSITADDLVITSTDNLVVEADFGNNGSSWDLTPAYKFIMPDTGRGSLPALRIVGGTIEVKSINLANKVKVDPNNRYRAAISVKSTEALPAGAVKMYLRCYTTAVSSTDILAVSNANPLVVSTWTNVTGMAPVLPAGTMAVEVIVAAQNGSTGTLTEIDYVSLTRAMDSQLVVDGSVTAASIAASAVNASHISAKAITASALDVNQLWADNSWLGTAGASTLTLKSTSTPVSSGSMAVSGGITYLTTSSEVDSQGIKVYNTVTDASGNYIEDGETIIQLGTYDKDYFQINSGDASTLINMNDEGKITAKTLEAENITYKGDDLDYYLDRRPRGMAAWGQVPITTSMAASNSGEVGLFEIAWDAQDADNGALDDQLNLQRMYEFSVNNFLINTGGAGTYGLRLRMTTDNTAPTINSPLIGFSYFRTDVSGLQGTGNFRRIIGSNNGASIRLLLSLYGTGSNSNVYNGTGQTYLYSTVMDLGATKPAAAVASTGGGTPYNGAAVVPTPAAAKITRTVEYGYYGVRTFQGSAPYNYNTAKAYQGLSPAGAGNLNSMYTFNQNFQTLLAGATVNDIWVYLYFEHWYYNAGGTAYIRLHNNLTTPATYVGMTTNGVTSASWPKGAGRWVRLPTPLYAGFQSGAYRGFGLIGDGTYATYGIANNARIKIRYTK